MSKMKMQAVVAGVESRVVKEGQPDQRTIYDVIDGDGVKWTAWELDIAKTAHQLKGVPAVWEVEQKQNGKYTNRTLLHIEGTGDPGMMNALVETPITTTTSSASNTITFDQPGTTVTPRDTSIHRQCAAKVVGAMAAGNGMTPDEFWLNIESLVHYFETGATPLSHLVTTVQQPQGQDLFPPADDDTPF